MAKKKDKDTDSGLSTLNKSELVTKSIQETYGDIISSGEDLLNRDQEILSISPRIDSILNGGIPEGTATFVVGKPKSGKDQPLYSLVYTPNGPKKMGDIQIGDEICTPNGGTARVLSVHPQGKKDVYRVYFTDNDYVDCGLDHLWKVYNVLDRARVKPRIMSLREIMDYGLDWGNGPNNKNRKSIWRVEMSGLVQFNEKDVPVDPYLLGVILGDGGISQESLGITNVDNELLDTVKDLVEEDKNYAFRQVSNTITYRVVKKHRSMSRVNNKYIKALKELGLMGLNSKEKFIPDIYKYNSKAVRLAVLQGLMDTDGSASKESYSGCSTVDYCSASKRLILDVKELCHSLGFLAKYRERYTSCNGKKFLSYRLYIKTNNNKQLFKLSRKINLATLRSKANIIRSIKKIEKITPTETQCIKLDSEDGLYLTDHCIVTHNTTLLLRACAQAQKQNRDVWYIDVEHRLGKKNIAGCAGLDPSPAKFHHIHSSEGQILNAQKILTIAVKVLTDIPRSMVVIDSFGALVTEEEMTNELKGRQRTDLHGLLSLWHKILCPIIQINKNYLFGVQHIYANVAPSGPMDKKKTVEAGSSKGMFLSSNKLSVKYFEYWDAGQDRVGQKVHWQCDFSELGAPGGSCESYLRYGVGIDILQELIMTGIDAGLIQRSGSWFNCPFIAKRAGGEPKFQGEAKLYDGIFETQEWQGWLENDLREMGAI